MISSDRSDSQLLHPRFPGLFLAFAFVLFFGPHLARFSAVAAALLSSSDLPSHRFLPNATAAGSFSGMFPSIIHPLG
jgi:hypothetical protein